MAYFAYYTELKNVQKDPNSDNLYTATCLMENVIVGNEAYDGMQVLYLPADGKIDRAFGDKFQLFRKNTDGTSQGGYLDDNGHIKALKLRGLRSEGIAIGIEKVKTVYPNFDHKLGAEFNTIGDYQFCQKYIPKQHRTPGAPGSKTSYKGRKAEGITYPEFSMHSDTAQLAYNEAAFHEGDEINISLKMHGTSQRSMNTYCEMPNGFFRRLFRMKKKQKPAFVLGTRRCVVTENSTGYYGNDQFRMPHHEIFKKVLAPGTEVFYEVVGYHSQDGTIMPSADNKKLNDKKFLKQFGPVTNFTYGCEPGESAAYVYRVTVDNGARELTPDEIVRWCKAAGVNYVPQIDNFIFTTWQDLLNRVNAYFEDLVDPIGKTHLKEGVVVRIVNRRTFAAFKSKTYEFKVLEGIIKEAATEADMEEAQEADGENNQ